MIEYKGYVGDARIDPDAGVIRGRVINTRDLITFQGGSVAEALAAFRDSIDDYLEFCTSRGEPPDKPFSGKFLVRVSPSSHRALALEARRRGISLNKLAGLTLVKLVRSSTHPAAAPPVREGAGDANVGAKFAQPAGTGATIRDARTGKVRRLGPRKARPTASPTSGALQTEEGSKI